MRKCLIKFTFISLILLLSFSITQIDAYAASNKPILKKGMSSSEVKKLQADLKQLGFFSLKPTGYYGEATVSAVKSFQKKYKLPATGVVAALTYNKLEVLLKPAGSKKNTAESAPARKTQPPDGLSKGMNNQAVFKLQNDLKLLGYLKVSPTGDFGPLTEAALIQFQKYYHLDPNGIAGNDTLSVIERLLRQADPVSRGDSGRGNEERLVIKPLNEVKLQWIPGLIQAPFLKGIGKYDGVVFHFTENMKDTAQLEADYEKRHWREAFVHEFIDPKEIIQVADPDYKASGAGQYANDRFIHLELCHADNQSDFDASYGMMTQRAAEYLYMLKLGVSPAKADGTGTLWSHMDVTNYLGGTNHKDPIAYLAKWGITWDDVISTVTEKYNALAGRNTDSAITDSNSDNNISAGDTEGNGNVSDNSTVDSIEDDNSESAP